MEDDRNGMHAILNLEGSNRQCVRPHVSGLNTLQMGLVSYHLSTCMW